MSILITGVDGFIGQHLARELILYKEKLIVTTKSNTLVFSLLTLEEQAHLNLFTGIDIVTSLKIKDIIVQHKPKTIYHLAAHSHVPTANQNPSLTFTTNVIGTLNLLEIISSLNLNGNYNPIVLITSSAQVYGSVPVNEQPLLEVSPLKPANIYAASKVAQEFTALSYFYRYGIPVLITRGFNHIGLGQSTNFVIPSIANQISEIELGLRVPTIKIGNLDAYRDFIDVRDAVKAYVKLTYKSKPGMIYNVCSSTKTSIKEILEILLGLSPVKINIEIDKSKLRSKDACVLFGSNTKLRKTINWQPTIKIQQTLQDILQEHRLKVLKARTEA